MPLSPQPNPPVAGRAHRELPLKIGTRRDRTDRAQRVEQLRGRMPVVVAEPDPDEADRRPNVLVGLGGLVGGAVVGDLHDIDVAQRRRAQLRRAEHPQLRNLAEVAQ